MATDKARTAAIYRRPSKDFEEQASGGRPSALHLARAVPLQGGMPIMVEGEVVGAVGVSGARRPTRTRSWRRSARLPRAANGERATALRTSRARRSKFRRAASCSSGRYKIDAGRR